MEGNQNNLKNYETSFTNAPLFIIQEVFFQNLMLMFFVFSGFYLPAFLFLIYPEGFTPIFSYHTPPRFQSVVNPLYVSEDLGSNPSIMRTFIEQIDRLIIIKWLENAGSRMGHTLNFKNPLLVCFHYLFLLILNKSNLHQSAQFGGLNVLMFLMSKPPNFHCNRWFNRFIKKFHESKQKKNIFTNQNNLNIIANPI